MHFCKTSILLFMYIFFPFIEIASYNNIVCQYSIYKKLRKKCDLINNDMSNDRESHSFEVLSIICSQFIKQNTLQ